MHRGRKITVDMFFAREWIGVKGRNLLPPPYCCILRHHLPVPIHRKSPFPAPKDYTAGRSPITAMDERTFHICLTRRICEQATCHLKFPESFHFQHEITQPKKKHPLALNRNRNHPRKENGCPSQYTNDRIHPSYPPDQVVCMILL